MAGSGNLCVLRIARELHKRHSAEITYGNHMAVHMAVGFLFLGAGRFVGVLLGLKNSLKTTEMTACCCTFIESFNYVSDVSYILGEHCQRLVQQPLR